MSTIADLKKDFQKLVKTNKLSHGYLLFGHESANEKIVFAKELAGSFEGGAAVLLDALFLDARTDGGIDLVRSASNFLWQKPAVSPRRTLIIENADFLTLPAQNAILKIAEEPPVSTLIFLVVKDHDGLLPAVVSRFQKIFVSGESGIKNNESGMAREFLKSGLSQRKEVLKNLMEEVKEDESDQKLEEFVTGLFAELSKDK